MTADLKADVRVRIRARRKALSQALRAAYQGRINATLLELVPAQPPRVIGVYAAMGSEVSVDAAAQEWQECGHRVAWPKVVAEDRLGFFQGRLAGLVPGFRGIREPGPAMEPIEAGEIDVLIVPGLAFDRSGCRLGQGGGFYDRLLADPDVVATTIGVAFGLQIVPTVPRDSNDKSVDVVITEIAHAQTGTWGL